MQKMFKGTPKILLLLLEEQYTIFCVLEFREKQMFLCAKLAAS